MLLFLAALVFASVVAKAEDEDGPYVVYKNGVISERYLPLCAGPRESCNVVRQRFWLSPIVYRMCKCPDRTSCPTDFTDLSDKRSIGFNPRSQLKFCSRVGELEYCGENSVAAALRRNGTIHVHCYCSPNHFYHRLYRNSTGQYYKCVPYGTCWEGDFCGYITTSTYETYHHCTCPKKHICILRDRNRVYADEFLYQGPAYRGICVRRN